ncbi:hypothetical protein ERJ75_001655100 [Trypanosoma vivax]|uniref:Guanine nucleotide-binding protein subunit beta-like protein n=1 Tax=Trypanosoma vivax (strain Y486) TaxID=1055687 RepID=G0U9F1_TRYVY|nr:hypothetical protein TRVL_06908 [Trypanosoma vivax]KAH8605167.1 hypothetical protein ERJ75_001655100 [Trypanosoma vivax]CCC54237.1 putative Hypothetical protein [Trypanosoma vivax Y486]
MEVLGRDRGSVMSVAASGISATSFASINAAGKVTLWDVRLQHKDCMSVTTDINMLSGAEATDLLLAADMHVAVALAGGAIIAYDLRQQGVLSVYNHTCDNEAFLAGTHPPAEQTTLIADENGAIMPFDLKQCRPTAHLSDRFFGTSTTISATSFGALSNICCGLGFIRPEGEKPLLCAMGMDGSGALYTDPQLTPSGFSLLQESDLVEASGKVLNPPLPISASFLEGYVAIGRANGMYSIAVPVANSTLFEVLAAPGHACNGLSVLEWTRGDRPRLLTCSVCGVVSLWDVMPLVLETPEGDEVIDEDLPSLDVAESVRDAVGQQVSVNCGAVIGDNLLVVGDAMGFITSCLLV